MTTATNQAPVRVEPRDARAGSRARRRRFLDAAAVAVPAAIALALCLYGITARSLGFDEAASVAIASQHGSALAHAIAHDGGNMSVYYLLLHVLIGWLGDGLAVIRAPSAVAAAATVALTGLLALRWFGRKAALVAGLLTAVSLPLVFWGQSARGYAPMVALATGSFVSLHVLLERPGRRPAAGLAYAACTTLAIYCGFVAVLVVLAQLAGSPRALRRAKSALVAVALCCTPLLVLAVSRGSGQLFWVPRPSVTGDRQVLTALASAGLPPSFHTTTTTLALLCLTAAMVAGLALTGPRRTAPVFAWLAVPVAVAWLESIVGQPVFLPRNLLIAVPAVSLLVAVAVTDHWVPAPAASALTAVLIALRLLQVTAAYGVSPEDWKSATAYVLARSAPGDCIAFYPSDAHMAFGYYVRTGVPRSVLPDVPWTNPPRPFVEDYASLARVPPGCIRLWLVSSHHGQPDGPAGARANLARFKRLRTRLNAAYAQHHTTTFGYAATITVELLQGRRVVPTNVR